MNLPSCLTHLGFLSPNWCFWQIKSCKIKSVLNVSIKNDFANIYSMTFIDQWSPKVNHLPMSSLSPTYHIDTKILSKCWQEVAVRGEVIFLDLVTQLWFFSILHISGDTILICHRLLFSKVLTPKELWQITVNQGKNFFFKLHYWKAMVVLGFSYPLGKVRIRNCSYYLLWHLQRANSWINLYIRTIPKTSKTKLYLFLYKLSCLKCYL